MENFEDICGQAKKLKSSSVSSIFGSTNLRWFELSFSQKTFGYKLTRSDPECKVIYNFTEIVDFSDKLSESLMSKCDWHYGIEVKTFLKDYYLFFYNEREHKTWVKAFNIVLKKIPEAFPKIPDNIFYVRTLQPQLSSN